MEESFKEAFSQGTATTGGGAEKESRPICPCSPFQQKHLKEGGKTIGSVAERGVGGGGLNQFVCGREYCDQA